MGGKEAVKALRAHHAGVRAVVSSGYSDEPIMSEYEKYGFDCVIAKPWTPYALTRIVSDVRVLKGLQGLYGHFQVKAAGSQVEYLEAC